MTGQRPVHANRWPFELKRAPGPRVRRSLFPKTKPATIDREALSLAAPHPQAQKHPRRSLKSWGRMVGPGRFERPTSRLSGVRSNQLSYGPASADEANQLHQTTNPQPGRACAQPGSDTDTKTPSPKGQNLDPGEAWFGREVQTAVE